jgi:hypothetical protein
MILSAIVAAALVAQQPAAKEPAKPPAVGADQKAGVAKQARKSRTPSERRQEERRIRAFLEGKSNRPVTPGEILFVGPPPGESTVVSLSPQKGCKQMIDLLIPSPGNRLLAARTLETAQSNAAAGNNIELDYAYGYVPFKARAISTAVYDAPVRDATPIQLGPVPLLPELVASDPFYVFTLYHIPTPITQVMPLEGPLKGRPVWVLHTNFYVLDKKAADLSYEDRVKLWESLAKKPTRTKSRTRQPQKKAQQAR